MTYKLFVFGKLKEAYLNDAVKDYVERLKHYRSLEIIELKDEKEPKNPSLKDIEGLKEKEAETFFKQYKEGPIFLWDETGKKMNSIQFSEWLSSQEVSQSKDFNFVIGGSNGHSKKLKEHANTLLSLSDLTFPHGVARLIILEQFYRAFKIQRNETYHK
jgi:23S rRNA (pseudouridine1915-N3)-methyltransferase